MLDGPLALAVVLARERKRVREPIKMATMKATHGRYKTTKSNQSPLFESVSSPQGTI
jgi:hypothetical protein